MSRFEAEIANEDDVKENEVHKIVWLGRPIILFKKEGRIHAYIDACPHVGGPLVMKEGSLICEWHDSRFDLSSGKTIKGPAPESSELIPVSIEVREGKIYYVYPPNRARGEWHIS